MAVSDLVVGSPIRRRNLIRDPGGKNFCWLDRDVGDGFGYVGNTVYNSLSRILRR